MFAGRGAKASSQSLSRTAKVPERTWAGLGAQGAAIRLAKKRPVVHDRDMKTLARTTDDLSGTYRTFGEEGPVYEVLRKVDEMTVHIVIIETGEALNYPAAEALNDPEAE